MEEHFNVSFHLINEKTWLTSRSAESVIIGRPCFIWRGVTTSFSPVKDVSLILSEATDFGILKVTVSFNTQNTKLISPKKQQDKRLQ